MKRKNKCDVAGTSGRMALKSAELRHAFRPALEIERADGAPTRIRVFSATVFTNWLSLKGTILTAIVDADVIVDLSESTFIDHSVMDRLHELEREFSSNEWKLTVAGLENHDPVSGHPKAARKKRSHPDQLEQFGL